MVVFIEEMIIFILMLTKIIATFSINPHPLAMAPDSASPFIWLVWFVDPSSASLLAFDTPYEFIIFTGYFFVWLISPWLIIFQKSEVSTAGFWIVLAINLFDIVCILLTPLEPLIKLLNICYSVLVIGISVVVILRRYRQ